jgi:hypothetical protein
MIAASDNWSDIEPADLKTAPQTDANGVSG